MSIITAQEATKIANQYFQLIIGHFGVQTTVEEIERNEDNDWIVTLSYPNNDFFAAKNQTKDHKVFIVDSKNGDVLSMKVK